MPEPSKSSQCTNCGYSGNSEDFDKILVDEGSAADDSVVRYDLRCPNCNTILYGNFEFETEIVEPKNLDQKEDCTICSALQNLSKEI